MNLPLSLRLALLAASFLPALLTAQAPPPDSSPLFSVGVASRDITPDYPVRLSGYGGRRLPSTGVAQKIYAKALAFGDDGGSGPAVVLTVDNCGVPATLREEVHRRLAAKVPLANHRFSICSSHTHCAPMLSGVLSNLFGMDIPGEHQVAIERYTREFTDALEMVALDALSRRRPSRLAWGIGSVGFAVNRRAFPLRPVDHALPVLRVTDADGRVTAVWTGYACHCTTLGIDEIHGDWAGCAQAALQREFPGAVALTAVGCGADQNPIPRRTREWAAQYGEILAAEAARLVRSPLVPISSLPECAAKEISLAYDTLPTREALVKLAASPTGAIAYHARKNLDRLDRGEALPTSLPYLVQTWSFGDALAMVFLPGEVVVDYSLSIKTEFDHRRLWVHGYSNDVPAYIPSKRILDEGGYEGGGAMVYYDRPTRFAADVESRILGAVRELVPPGFKASSTRSASGASLPSPFAPDSPRLILPPNLYAVGGIECSVYLANALASGDPKQFRFQVDCPVGKQDGSLWRWVPQALDVGRHPFTLRMFDISGRPVAAASATLHVSAADAGAGREECTTLIVGDSLTSAGAYPDEIARLFSLPGNPRLAMLGTQTKRPAASPRTHVAYEGYGGWTWKSFFSRYDTEEPRAGGANRSPFVFVAGEPPMVAPDVGRYLRERAGGRVPEFIPVLLGINDCFRLKADAPTALDQGITDMLFYAEKLSAEFRRAAPKAVLGICLVPPPNDRDASFEANYAGKYPRGNWKKIQTRLVERQLKHFLDREKEGLEVVPIGWNLDTWEGYPEGNAVHPNEAGYRQIASAIYAWMKHRLSAGDPGDPK